MRCPPLVHAAHHCCISVHHQCLLNNAHQRRLISAN
ncbi:unnamed protein product, partial [Staurois parvus]